QDIAKFSYYHGEVSAPTSVTMASQNTNLPSDFVAGQSAKMGVLNETLAGLAQTDMPVLIVGESGTGKDVYARRLHELSLRAVGSFERISCASTDDHQIRGKLQSYVQKPSVRPGTLFLHEVHELGATAQRYLLAFLDSPGATLNPRVVASAPDGIECEVEAGHFRSELYFRLKGACLRLPPLRERKEDLPILLEHFLAKHAKALNRPTLTVRQPDLDILAAYDWPGNLRELENWAIRLIAVGHAQVDPIDLRSGARRVRLPETRHLSL